jgi:hypothetical protein
MSCEMPAVYDCETPTARQLHKCCECRGEIQPGEQYHKHHGLWDGEWGVFKVCLDCDALRKEVDADIRDPEDWTPFEGLTDTMVEAGNVELLSRFIGIKLMRNATVHPWLHDVLAELRDQQTNANIS